MTLIGLLTVVAAPPESQAPLEQVALFSRCYTHMTGESLPGNHSLRSQVMNQSISAVDACMQVLNSALLNSDGAQVGMLQNDNAEARKVIQNFNDIHRSWFPNDDVANAIPDQPLQTTALFYDQLEPSLHFSRALFDSQVSVSEIVTGNFVMEAVRSEGPTPLSDFRTDDPGYQPIQASSVSPEGGGGTIPIAGIDFVQAGRLIGIRAITPSHPKYSAGINTPTEKVDYEDYNNTRNLTTSQAFPYQSLGGGILGSKSYLLMNFGTNVEETSDGGLHLPRRWSKAVFKDFLCRDLPVLRASDALPFVEQNSGADTPPFRNGSSCMTCHQSMDPMAGVARNIASHFSDKNFALGSVHPYVWPVDRQPEGGRVDNDYNYYRRPPSGQIYFRSSDGTLVDISVEGIDELGDSLSQMDDFYNCVTSRYFTHFTGVKVNLQDIGDTNLPSLDAGELHYRNLVLQMAQNLRTNQDLRELIREILQSPLYSKSSMRDVQE